MSAPTLIDWTKVEPHYRAGLRSLPDLAGEFGVSHTAIAKHAKKNGWARDLKAKIKAKADAKVSRAMVSAEVSDEARLTENLRVEVEAEVQARIRLSHRKDISRARGVALTLLAELEFQTGNQDLFDELQDLMQPEAAADDTAAARDRAYKLREAFNKAMSLGGRTKTMKDLADTLKTLVGLEREAFGLAEMAQLPKAPETVDPLDVARRLAFVFAEARTLQ